MDVGTSQPDDEYDDSDLLYPPNRGLWSVQGFPVNHRFPPEQLLRIANPRFCLNHVRSRCESEVTGGSAKWPQDGARSHGRPRLRKRAGQLLVSSRVSRETRSERARGGASATERGRLLR